MSAIILRTDVPYDIFEHADGVELVAWASTTERADPVTLRPTVTRASTGQRYLGTMAPSLMADTAQEKRPIWNYKQPEASK